MTTSKRYYSRVAGARFIFANGQDCYFPEHYYETADPREQAELDALVAKNNNPLIFTAEDGKLPEFKKQDPGLAPGVPRSTAAASDALLAAMIAESHNGQLQLRHENLPQELQQVITPDALNAINAILAVGATGDGSAPANMQVSNIFPPVTPPADPVVAELLKQQASTPPAANNAALSFAGLAALAATAKGGDPGISAAEPAEGGAASQASDSQ